LQGPYLIAILYFPLLISLFLYSTVMKLIFLYFALMTSMTKAEDVLRPPINSEVYHHVLNEDGASGPCRGSTASDKVDNRSKGGLTQAMCEAECDGDANCVGYSYAAGSEGGFCLLYGPGQDGNCADFAADILDHCGSCSVDGKIDKNTCGSCSIPDGTPVFAGASSYADNEGLCKLQQGQWTKGTWTEGTWNEPANGWVGGSHLTTHVHFVTAVDGYDCYDKDRSDHMPMCEGTTDANSSCQTRFAQEIDGKELKDLTEGDCTAGGSGCTFIPAPVPPASIFFVHSPIKTTPGWNEWNVPIGDSLNPAVPIALGACRSEGTMIAPPTQKDCKNEECRGSNGEFVGTQEGCKQACLDDPSGTCVSYSHADGQWCVLHGPHAHVFGTHTNTFDGEVWQDTWNLRDRALKFCLNNVENNPPGCEQCDSAKPNPKYMCQTLKTDFTRWQAFGPSQGSPTQLSFVVSITGGTEGLDMELLRRRVADLAFWKESMTSVTTSSDEDGTKLNFMLEGLDTSFSEGMMRLMNGQFDETNIDTLMSDVLPDDVTATGSNTKVMNASTSGACMQTLAGATILALINTLITMF